jgi:hypothetical protein
LRKENAKLVRSEWDEDGNSSSSSSCAARRRNFYIKKIKNKNRNQRQIVATQKRKKMKKGVVAAALVQGAQQKFRSQQRTKKLKIKIATRSLRNKHTRKVHENCTYTTGKSAKSERRNPHKIQRRKEGPSNK